MDGAGVVSSEAFTSRPRSGRGVLHVYGVAKQRANQWVCGGCKVICGSRIG